MDRMPTMICWWWTMEYAFQAIGIYAESTVASALKERDYKDATDLIIGGGG